MVGQTLADVALPQGFFWQAPLDTPVGEIGMQQFLATYIPDDTQNELTLTDLSLTVAVRAAPTAEEANPTSEGSGLWMVYGGCGIVALCALLFVLCGVKKRKR